MRDDKRGVPIPVSRLQTRFSTEVDRDVVAFFTTYVDSFIKWDLLQFFDKNSSTLDTAENIARYIGRVAGEVEPELQILVKAGLLKHSTIGNLRVYRLEGDAKLRRRLAEFVAAAADSDFRRQAIYYLVRQ